MTDHPHVRALGSCPRCVRPKQYGLLLCWECHKALKAQYDGGYGPWEMKLDQFERDIAAERAAGVDEAGSDMPKTDS